MNDNYRRLFGTSLLAMIESLRTSVTTAGGAADALCSVVRLQEISAFDLLCELSTNHIRFAYIAPETTPTH